MTFFKPPYLGAAYYPEDWPFEQIDGDIALMQQTGINMVRLGEFAWSMMEPEEGRFEFAWLHKVVDKLGQADIATILGTPTCTPPIWLIEKHPEVLVVDDFGRRAQHGGRRHACPNNPVYRDYCAIIVRKLAEEFGQEKHIIGWQIDNEPYPNRPRGCCCPVCHKKFQDAMREKYKSIEELNRIWVTNLWSQTYQSFSQLPVPRADSWHHPSLLTMWMNFQSDSYIEFIAAQARILHKICTQPVGTDVWYIGGLDYFKMYRDLDVVQLNHYLDQDNLWNCVFWMDLGRPLKKRPFWNTETSTCWNGSTTPGGYRPAGFCRANSWLSLALGGEATAYWLWRAHCAGQELMHGSVISSCGRGLHIIDEVKEVADGFNASAEFINNTRCLEPQMAVHFSSLAWWMFEFQPMVRDFKYHKMLTECFYRSLLDSCLRADVIYPQASLDHYRVVCSPFLPALDESGLRGRIKNWIKEGGSWIVGPLSDNRSLDATKFTHSPFGSLEDWAGVYCKYQIPADKCNFRLRWNNGDESTGKIWYDGFEVNEGQALATYTDGPLKGLAAVVQRNIGKGRIVLLGTMPEAGALQKLLISITSQAGIAPAAKADSNLLVVPRKGKAGEGAVVIELENRKGSMVLPKPATELLGGNRLSGEICVRPYGVLVLQYES